MIRIIEHLNSSSWTPSSMRRWHENRSSRWWSCHSSSTELRCANFCIFNAFNCWQKLQKDVQAARQTSSLTYWLTGNLAGWMGGWGGRWGDEEQDTGWYGAVGGWGRSVRSRQSGSTPLHLLARQANESFAALKPWSGQNSTMSMGIVACHL